MTVGDHIEALDSALAIVHDHRYRFLSAVESLAIASEALLEAHRRCDVTEAPGMSQAGHESAEDQSLQRLKKCRANVEKALDILKY